MHDLSILWHPLITVKSFTHRRLNLLIAIMGDSYEKVKESERVEAIRERARIVVEEEKRFPKSHCYHRFMHFVEAVDTSRSEERLWEGVTKRVAHIMSTETSDLKDEMNTKLNEIDTKLIKLKGEMKNEAVELKDEMNAKLERLDSKLDTILDSLR